LFAEAAVNRDGLAILEAFNHHVEHECLRDCNSLGHLQRPRY
jgi:hypothetical protein